MFKKLLTEFLGTFILVVVVAFSQNPLAVAGIFAALTYAWGSISGGYFNPALNLASLVAGKMKFKDFAWYTVVQLLAGFLGALVFLAFAQSNYQPATQIDLGLGIVFVAELIFTFALATVFVRTTLLSKTSEFAGLALGLVIMAGAITANSISGGLFNPAVVTGPTLLNYNQLSVNGSFLLVVLLAEVLGGVVAGFLVRLQEGTIKLAGATKKTKTSKKK